MHVFELSLLLPAPSIVPVLAQDLMKYLIRSECSFCLEGVSIYSIWKSLIYACTSHLQIFQFKFDVLAWQERPWPCDLWNIQVGGFPIIRGVVILPSGNTTWKSSTHQDMATRKLCRWPRGRSEVIGRESPRVCRMSSAITMTSDMTTRQGLRMRWHNNGKMLAILRATRNHILPK